MIALLPLMAQGLFVLILVGLLAWLLRQPPPQGDDDPDQSQREWRTERARNQLLAVFREAAKAGGDPKTVYRRAVQHLIAQHVAAKQKGRVKRVEQLAALLDLLKADPPAGLDLCRNQLEWSAMAPEERQAIVLARRAYELQNVPRCRTCSNPLYFLVSRETGQCVRCRSTRS